MKWREYDRSQHLWTWTCIYHRWYLYSDWKTICRLWAEHPITFHNFPGHSTAWENQSSLWGGDAKRFWKLGPKVSVPNFVWVKASGRLLSSLPRTFSRHRCLTLVSPPRSMHLETCYRPANEFEKSPTLKTKMNHLIRPSHDVVPSMTIAEAALRACLNPSFEAESRDGNDDL